jgi:ferredoxin
MTGQEVLRESGKKSDARTAGIARSAARPGAGFAGKAVTNAGPGASERALPMVPIWSGKRNSRMSRTPLIDLSGCTDCESCLSLCPSVFQRNQETDFIEVRELPDYPIEEIESVMTMCPARCIQWEES